MWFVQPVDGETSQDKKSAGWGQGLGQEGKRVWPFLWLLEQWGLGARGVSLSSLPVAHHSTARAPASCHTDFRTGGAPESLCRAAQLWTWPGEVRVCWIQPDRTGTILDFITCYLGRLGHIV